MKGVTVAQGKSLPPQVISGIPQGSMLGPLLFIIYVNDIQETCILGSELYVYADDSKLFRYISGELVSNLRRSYLIEFAVFYWIRTM